MLLRPVVALLASLAFTLVSLFSLDASATHFRYGNVSYTVDQASPLSVSFTVTVAWRSTYQPVDSTSLVFGDGQTNPADVGKLIGSGVDTTGQQYDVYQYRVSHAYPSPGVYTAYFTSCCRLSSLVNAGDDTFRVEAKVDLTAGNLGNAATALPAVVQVQTGGVRTLSIVAADPDLVPVHCRFATTAESGIVTNPPVIPATGMAPTLTDTPLGCTLTWNATGAPAGQQFAINVVLESMNGPTMATAMLDFIVETIATPVPTCTGGGVFELDIDDAFSEVATGVDLGSLLLGYVGSFGGTSPPVGTVGPSPFAATAVGLILPITTPANAMVVTFTNAQNVTGYCGYVVLVAPCPGYGMACSAGLGVCENVGHMHCVGGSLQCSVASGLPSPEVCNALDDDCDGIVDQGNPQGGQVCATAFPGPCATGVSTCSAGNLVCVPDVAPGSVPESCNGDDDDCDGVVDDGFSVGVACSVGLGACAAQGAFACTGPAASACDAVAGAPSLEICNGVDDDCDGQIDEGFVVNLPCTSGVGACQAAGVLVCDPASGGAACGAAPGAPSPEVCGNGLDDDCDGVVDSGCPDTDGDGLPDSVELAAGLDPDDADTDDDGVLDGDEPDWSGDADDDGLLQALDPDSDDDGLMDGTELGLGCSSPDTLVSAGFCVPDADPTTQTDPLERDSDGGGATDGSEDSNLDGAVDPGEADPSAPGDDAAVVDADGDGLSDALEGWLGSNPADADSDDDGALDGEEPNPAADMDGDGLPDVLDADSDDDALPDGLELGKGCDHPDTDASLGRCKADADHGATKTSAVDGDSDGGGASDGAEDPNQNGVQNTGGPDPSDDAGVADTDGDGLGDDLELALGSDPDDADTDDDGVLDGDEHNPGDDLDGDGLIGVLDPDSDGDGLFDGTEAGLGCANADTDPSALHCVADADGGTTHTFVLVADTDGGGATDGEEDEDRDGAVDAGERDPLDPSDDAFNPCGGDADCPGQVCSPDGACVEGCHDGVGCPPGLVCTSQAADIGACIDDGAGGSGGGGGGGGCGCSVPVREGAEAPWLAAGLALVAAGARRRRASRALPRATL